MAVSLIWDPPVDPTPASRDREEHRGAARLTSEVEEHAGCTRRCCMDPQEIEP